MKNWCFIRALKAIVFVTLGVLAFGFIVMKLWNGLVPELFHGPVINFCQAFGLLVLAKIVFGGFGRWGCGGRCKNRSHWRARFEEKLAKMTPEEREKFKSSFRGKCGSRWEHSHSCEPDVKPEA